MSTQEWTEEVPHFDIHTRIRQAREFRGLDQGDLAALTLISRGTISNYESGATRNLKPLYLQKIAEALRIPLPWLLTGQISAGDMPPGPGIPLTTRVTGSLVDISTRNPPWSRQDSHSDHLAA
jgi:transcriptional regulator with XRE-family HTH domain